MLAWQLCRLLRASLGGWAVWPGSYPRGRGGDIAQVTAPGELKGSSPRAGNDAINVVPDDWQAGSSPWAGKRRPGTLATSTG